MDHSGPNALATPEVLIGLAVALGIGLLIGVDRERRKGDRERREAAGLRTFAVACFAGALAQVLPVPTLVPIGAVLVAVLAAISHWKSSSPDPGMTTELALFTTYMIGTLTVTAPSLGAACGAGLALLLVTRQWLHRFATQLLSEQELHDGILLAALALIALPLIPTRSIEWLGGMEPRPLAAMVLLILFIQAVGHVGMRWLGVRGGVLAAGLLSGFISSTATVASLGSQARKLPEQTPMLAGGACLSAVATWIQALAVSAALSPRAAIALMPAALAGALAAAGIGSLVLLERGPTKPIKPSTTTHSALRPREALTIALVMALVALLVAAAQRHYGDAGLQVSVALVALVDAHAPVASLASLHAANSLPTAQFVHGALIAVGVNTMVRCMVALVTGGPRYGLRVGAALLGSLACAYAVNRWLSAA
ncbi:MgtC/SapB family protein [Ottowia thiooxydans]|uniref:Uncharacterized membrane protein (DUF4010 family) n=1 Tax=Ottowia thiooxydans TaxID=219182 RepID=A0ABV2QB04_9BURK